MKMRVKEGAERASIAHTLLHMHTEEAARLHLCGCVWSFSINRRRGGRRGYGAGELNGVSRGVSESIVRRDVVHRGRLHVIALHPL